MAMHKKYSPRVPVVTQDVSATDAMKALTEHHAPGALVEDRDGFRFYPLDEIAAALHADGHGHLGHAKFEKVRLEDVELITEAGQAFAKISAHALTGLRVRVPSWKCPEGDYSSYTSGECPNHHKALIKD